MQEFGDLFTRLQTLQPGLDLTTFDLDDRTVNVAAPNGRDSDTENIYANIEWAINEHWTLNSVTSAQSWEQHVDRGVGPLGAGDASNGPVLLNPFLTLSDNDSKTQELRFTYQAGELTSVLGGFYSDSELRNRTDFLNTAAILPSGFILRSAVLVDNTDDIEEWGLFSHNTYSIGDSLDVIFGLRYSEVSIDSVLGQQLGSGAFAAQHAGLLPVTTWDTPAQSNSWNAITGTLKLVKFIRDDLSVYGGYDRGFKAGGHNVAKSITGSPATPDVPPSFDEEYGDAFEVGMKGFLLDKRLRFGSALFYQLYSDYQVELQDEEGIGNVIVNAAEVVVQGLEFEFMWLASRHLVIDGNAAYTDARFSDYDNANCIRPQYARRACRTETAPGSGVFVQDLSDQRVNGNSPWTANLNATWSDRFANGLDWYLRAELAFRDDVIYMPDLDPASRAASYTLYNASVGISHPDKQWQVIVWGKNLTDENYERSFLTNRDAGRGPTAIEGIGAQLGEERSYGVAVSYAF